VKIKAILDTNVLISGVFWKGPPFEILKAWQEQRFRLAISLPILEEYRRVLDEFAKERQMLVSTPFSKLSSSARRSLSRSRFPSPFAAILMMTNSWRPQLLQAPYIVSGDKALLNVKFHHEVEVVRPSRFLKLLSR
jgi:predicted nucleic acid-binding protein